MQLSLNIKNGNLIASAAKYFFKEVLLLTIDFLAFLHNFTSFVNFAFLPISEVVTCALYEASQ